MSAGASATGDGHADGDAPVAAEILEAVLEAGPRRPIRRAVRTIGALALAVVGAADVDDLGRESDLVVRRIDTGREVLRTNAGSPVEADALLQRVRLDLETRTVRDFVADWRLIDPGPGAGSGAGTGAHDG